jgi:GNAT superfamily N-acetyltransferase
MGVSHVGEAQVNLIQGSLPVEEAFALSTEAGWNQTLGDWERLIQIAGDGCFAIAAGGRLVSTSVALVYESRLAWIGMVLTSAEHRGRGYARTLLERSLSYCDEQGVTCVKLDATDQGRPVYQKLGFIDERPVSRWARKAGTLLPKPSGISARVDLALDEEAFGADRSALLLALAQNETFSITGHGHAFARPGRSSRHFGPCVARDAHTAETLLHAFLARHGDEPSMLDLCDENKDAVHIANAAGYEPIRHLVRMYRGDPVGAPIASGPMIYALGAFEYG